LFVFGFVLGQGTPPKHGDVKLWHTVDESNFNYGSSGNSIGFGFLLVFYNGEWGTVCDNGFSQESANVVCRQIGWKSAETVFFDKKYIFFAKIWIFILLACFPFYHYFPFSIFGFGFVHGFIFLFRFFIYLFLDNCFSV